MAKSSEFCFITDLNSLYFEGIDLAHGYGILFLFLSPYFLQLYIEATSASRQKRHFDTPHIICTTGK